MTGETYDLSAQFFNAIKDALASVGKSLQYGEEQTIMEFLRPGLRKLEERDSYDYIMEVEKRVVNKILAIAKPNMSIIDILRKLCPMDPFC